MLGESVSPAVPTNKVFTVCSAKIMEDNKQVLIFLILMFATQAEMLRHPKTKTLYFAAHSSQRV